MQVITNATVSVDSFLVLSGLLVAYTLLKELDRSKGRFNVLLFYVHRYLRYTSFVTEIPQNVTLLFLLITPQD
jgi:peptidoglycan/LPS O-acetylase OafA/YrhL